MTKGDRIIDAIIEGKLFTTEVFNGKAITVWSPGAAEQLEAICYQVPKEYPDLLLAVDRHLEGLTDDEKLEDGALLLHHCFKMLKELP